MIYASRYYRVSEDLSAIELISLLLLLLYYIQTAAITGNIRGMYDGIKKALGPTQSNTAPSNPLLGR